MRRYSRRMYRWCRVAGLQPADAANVVQEAFAVLARKLPEFRRDREGDTFRGWLRRIVDNKIRDHYRNLAKRADVAAGGTDAQGLLLDRAWTSGGLTVEDSDAGGSGQSGQREVLDAIEEVRRQVGDRNWRLFWRVAVDGQSAVDVGREFGVTANTVRIVKMRVLRRIRSKLDVSPA